jgi:hypothetical protein
VNELVHDADEQADLISHEPAAGPVCRAYRIVELMSAEVLAPDMV